MRIESRGRFDSFIPIFAMISRRQQAASQRIERVKTNPIAPQAGQEFSFDGAVDSVIDALVDSRTDPSVPYAQLADSCDLPAHIVAQAEPGESAFFMQVVAGAKGFFERGGAVGTVEVPEVEVGGVQGLEGRREVLAEAAG